MSEKTTAGNSAKRKDKEEHQKNSGDGQKSTDKLIATDGNVVSYEARYKDIFDHGNGEAILQCSEGLPVHPMCVAVSVGHLRAINRMVKAGADINCTIQNTNGCTALHVAVQQGRQEVVECLLHLGADMCAQNSDGDTPFMIALAGSRKQNLRQLWKYRPRTHLKIANKHGCTALHTAVSVASETSVAVLVECEELDINAANNDGNTALMTAVCKTNMVKSLLRKNADILHENKEMVTALCISVKHNRSEVTNMLIEKMTTAERRKYINRRIELLRTTPATSENGNFFKSYLFCVITCMWRNEPMRAHMEPTSFIEPWLEKIKEFHRAPDGLCIHVPLASLALCMLDGPGHAVHRAAVDAFINLGGNGVILDLMPKYKNNAGVLSGLVLLLVPLAHSTTGIKWLEKNYLTLMIAYEAFNKELEFHIPNLEGLPPGLGQSLETFTNTLERIQAERSEQACRELLEEEYKEKTKKLKKKKEKDQGEKVKLSSNTPPIASTATKATTEKQSEEYDALKVDDIIDNPSTQPIEAEQFVPVVTKKQQKRNKKHKKASKSKDTSLSEQPDTSSIHSEKSTPSPTHAKPRVSADVLTSVTSSPGTDGGAASLSEGERAIARLVSAKELSFVHPDVKHRSRSREHKVSNKQTTDFSGQLEFLGDPLPQTIKTAEPWKPKSENQLQFLADHVPLQQKDDPWTPKAEHQLQFVVSPPHSTPKESSDVDNLLQHNEPRETPPACESPPKVPKSDEAAWAPKVDRRLFMDISPPAPVASDPRANKAPIISAPPVAQTTKEIPAVISTPPAPNETLVPDVTAPTASVQLSPQQTPWKPKVDQILNSEPVWVPRAETILYTENQSTITAIEYNQKQSSSSAVPLQNTTKASPGSAPCSTMEQHSSQDIGDAANCDPSKSLENGVTTQPFQERISQSPLCQENMQETSMVDDRALSNQPSPVQNLSPLVQNQPSPTRKQSLRIRSDKGVSDQTSNMQSKSKESPAHSDCCNGIDASPGVNAAEESVSSNNSSSQLDGDFGTNSESEISSTEATFYEQHGLFNQYPDIYANEKAFASGDVAVNGSKVDPDKSGSSANDSEIRSTFQGEADVQFHVVPENPLLINDSWDKANRFNGRLIDQEYLESIAQMPAVGEEFARLTPDPDPWYDNDTNFLPLKPSQLEPSLDTFTQLLIQQRNMAPSGEMMYGYDLHWKPKQTVHQTRKQDPWKQNFPYQRCKTYVPTSLSHEEAGRRRADGSSDVSVSSSQVGKGDSVRVGNQATDPYAQVNAYSSQTLLNLNGNEVASDKSKNTKSYTCTTTERHNGQQNISVIWGNRKEQDHARNKRSYNQMASKSKADPTTILSKKTSEQNTQEEISSQQIGQDEAASENQQHSKQDTAYQQEPEVATSTTTSVAQNQPIKSPLATDNRQTTCNKDKLLSVKTSSSPSTRPSSTDSLISQENATSNGSKAQKHSIDVLPVAHAISRTNPDAAKSRENPAGSKNKKSECIVKVAAWSKWKPACDAFMKTQWMFKYRIDQIAVAKHPEHYIVGRGPNDSIVMMGQMLNGSEVAVKRIPVALAASRQTNLLRLLEANISHKNVVPFVHFEMDSEHGYIVSELCEFNLRQHVFNLTSRGHMGPETGLHLCRELVQALDYLHGRGIIHGKLKPENVLIDMLGRIRLADYGIAISANGSPIKYDTAVSFWQTGEQIGYKADVQTCGMLMYFILSGGDHPFGNTEEEMLANLSKNRPKALQRTTDEADDLLKTLILYPQPLRPQTKKILRHPYFLDSSKRQELILAVWNELCEKRVETYAHLYTDLSRDDLYPQASRGWMAHIKDGVLHKVLEEVIVLRQGQVFSDNLLGLLEFIDNVTVCAQSFLSPGLQKELGDPAPRFSGLFPSLPLYLYRLVRAIIMRININFLDYYF